MMVWSDQVWSGNGERVYLAEELASLLGSEPNRYTSRVFDHRFARLKGVSVGQFHKRLFDQRNGP